MKILVTGGAGFWGANLCERPKLSVVIPVYRVEKYLRQCLDSIVNQTLRDMEIILINDGSPDNCGNICDEYAKKDDRILVVHKQNEGVSAARNEGLTRAAGEWVTFVDPDDWCDLDFYEQMFAALGDRQADVLFSGGCYREYVGKTEKNQVFDGPFLFTDEAHIESLRTKVICGICCEIGNRSTTAAVWNKLYRREFLEQNGLLFDATSQIWEDSLFNFRAMGKARAVGGSDHIGYHYRQVAVSASKGFDPRRSQINYDFAGKLYACLDDGTGPLLRQAVEVESLVLFQNALEHDCLHPANPKPYAQVARELRDMKTWPYYHQMIYSGGNPYFTAKQRIYRQLLRLPWSWPAYLAQRLRRRLNGQPAQQCYD